MQQKLTRQEQQEFANRLNKELDRMIMSWDKDMDKSWYHRAIEAMDHASALSLQMPQEMVIKMFDIENVQGLNMKVVQVLCNNIEARTPKEMGRSALEWAQFLVLNARIAQCWNELVAPVQQKILKEIEIMSGKAAGLKLIHAEA